ncbi:MAG TPA: response regulator transcription factor [Thermomicrobiales bacterium]|jgi:urea transport system substrate-binding protein
MPRILVIDDDPSIREAVGFVLADEGFHVDEAANGLAALAAIDRHHPDLILLDMKMPIMDGWEFARCYRARHDRRAPIIVVTAAQDAAQRGADVDADDYLAKPFDLDVLVQRVTASIGRRS